jgi:dienelactone hydrolase
MSEKRERNIVTTAAKRRQAILSRLGPFPSNVSLDLDLGQPADAGDHTHARVGYAVESGERVPAWLLRPNGRAPARGWPAILAIHQHGGEYDLGKSEPAGLSPNPMYHYGLDLCRRGYVVLCPDQLCFEERRPPAWLRQGNGQLYERFEFTQRVLGGTCLQTKYLHDLTRALDVLAGLPDVDAARLGVIGHSLGGQETLWLAWFDQRVRAAVSSCGFGLIRTILREGINHNFALYVPGLLEICDLDTMVADLAPRPFMLTAGTADALFPIDGVRAIVERAAAAYAEAGVPEHFRGIVFEGGHSFPDEIKAQAYAFLDQWVKQ